jgi:hypothetical protein
VNGSIANSAVTVNSGALLAGSGSGGRDHRQQRRHVRFPARSARPVR